MFYSIKFLQRYGYLLAVAVLVSFIGSNLFALNYAVGLTDLARIFHVDALWLSWVVMLIPIFLVGLQRIKGVPAAVFFLVVLIYFSYVQYDNFSSYMRTDETVLGIVRSVSFIVGYVVVTVLFYLAHRVRSEWEPAVENASSETTSTSLSE